MSLNDRLAAYFRARPNRWIDGRDLADVAGAYAWRSRCADLRKRGMRIENKQVRKEFMGQVWTESFYRYVPAEVMAEETTR